MRPLRYSIDVTLDGCSREPLEETRTKTAAELRKERVA